MMNHKSGDLLKYYNSYSGKEAIILILGIKPPDYPWSDQGDFRFYWVIMEGIVKSLHRDFIENLTTRTV
jgi:hypothetical protein